nr:MAG TPA: hypothetical protein [Bacteriophage sp.]
MSSKQFKQALNEIHDITYMLEQEGKSAAECRYCEIMYIRLLLIFETLSSVRMTLCCLLGMLAVHFIVS